MPKIKYLTLILFLVSTYVHAADIYISTTGNDTTGNGSIGLPYETIYKGITVASAGDTIYVRGGTHMIEPASPGNAVWIRLKNGTSGSRYTLKGYQDEVAILDGTNVPDVLAIIHLSSSSYWTIENLIVQNSTAPVEWATHGVYISGTSSNNIINNLEIRYNDGAGLMIEGSGSDNNYISNTYSHHNYDIDSDGGNADGFQVVGSTDGSTSPNNNIFYNCRSFNNGDDGFDLWRSYQSQIHYSHAWHNGYLPDGVTPVSTAGQGDGFKLGRGLADHTLTFNMSWDNRYIGFDYNQGSLNYQLYNNTSYNDNISYGFPTNANVDLRNNVAYAPVVRVLDANNTALGSFNTWNLSITAPDFISLDPDNPNFLRPSAASPLRDAGTDVGLSGADTSPDLGALPYVLPSVTYAGPVTGLGATASSTATFAGTPTNLGSQ